MCGGLNWPHRRQATARGAIRRPGPRRRTRPLDASEADKGDALTATTRPELTPSSEVDAALVARLAAGDQAALGLFYDRFARRVYSLVCRICRADTLTDDIVEEVFLSVWRTAGRFDPDRGSVATWVLTITHHLAVDAVRREATGRRHARPLDEHTGHDLPPRSEQTTGDAFVAGEVHDALAELPAGQREALVLAHCGGYTQSEVAVILGVPLGTVKSRTVTALRRLHPLVVDR